MKKLGASGFGGEGGGSNFSNLLAPRASGSRSLMLMAVGKTQMTCIERFEADKAAILGEWNSGDLVDIKYRT